MHKPVMLAEVLSALGPCAGEIYVDGTFGNGGYSRAILEAADCRIIALDRDPAVAPQAATLESKYGQRFTFVQTAFSNLGTLANIPAVDAVILDIGVSSMQIDQAGRGFSFMRSGPLDMRMAQSGPSAADAVRVLDLRDLTRIFQTYGEEKRARRAAQAIIRARELGKIETTDALADILERALGRSGKIHPATRVFQALRIFINDELGELYAALQAAEQILKPGGRLIVVAFHSLEDRIVKKFLRRRAERPSAGSRYLPNIETGEQAQSFTLTARKAVEPSAHEVEKNPRARSARLRWAVRTSAPAYDDKDGILPSAPRLSDFRWAA